MLNKFRAITALLALQFCLQPAIAEVQEGDTFGAWTGKCMSTSSGESYCGLSQDISENGTTMSRLLLRKVEEDVMALYVKVPLGVNIIANIKIAVDGELVADTPYTFCDPEGCNAVMPINPALAKVLKKGKTLSLVFFRVNEEFKFDASLSGVTKGMNSL